MNKRSYWDIFCKVIDNFGDIGVCWRLCTDLASRGYSIRLWVDDASALKWMAPEACEGVKLIDWSQPTSIESILQLISQQAMPSVIVEAFGCEPEPRYLDLLQAKCQANPAINSPFWINLEYLSAEKYVEKCHGLSSPTQQYPLLSQRKYFYYPGYTVLTGGLLRNPQELQQLEKLNQQEWLNSQNIPVPAHQEHIFVSLFCYKNAPLDSLLDFLTQRTYPSTLLVTDCVGAISLKHTVENHYSKAMGLLHIQYLPRLSQKDYSCLLHCCDLNVVRGEDSATQALWAKAPFIWQLYPQEDAYQLEKLTAFLNSFNLPTTIAKWFYDLNGASQKPLDNPNLSEWGEYFDQIRASLLAQNDLTSQLLQFIDTTSQAKSFKKA